MTKRIQDVDLILLQALKTNMHGVPSHYDSHVSNSTLELRIGSTTFGKNQTFQSITNLSEFIAKQVPCRPDSYSKQEPNVRTFVAGYKDDGIPYEFNIPFCCAKTAISVRQSKSLEDREIGKQFAPFVESFGRTAMEMTKVHLSSQRSTPAQVLSIKDRKNGVGKPVFKLAPFGSGQLFTTCCT